MKDLAHVYYVAYSHSRGFGCTEMAVTGGPLTTIKQVLDMTHVIESDNADRSTRGVVVLSYQLLRTEASRAPIAEGAGS